MKTTVHRHIRKTKKGRVPVKRHTRKLIRKRRYIGFSPEQKERMEHILEDDPRLKFKLEKTISDIQLVDDPSELGLGVEVNPKSRAFVQSKQGVDEARKIGTIKLNMIMNEVTQNLSPELAVALKEGALSDFNSKFIKDKDNRTLYLMKDTMTLPNPSIAKTLEHEVTHKAHEEKLGTKLFHKYGDESEKYMINPDDTIASNPTEVLAHLNIKGDSYQQVKQGLKKEQGFLDKYPEAKKKGFTKYGNKNLDEVYNKVIERQKRRDEFKKDLSRSNVKLRDLPNRWVPDELPDLSRQT